MGDKPDGPRLVAVCSKVFLDWHFSVKCDSHGTCIKAMNQMAIKATKFIDQGVLLLACICLNLNINNMIIAMVIMIITF
mgnify:CR=1 FL=1